jgi:hypothetical protein
VLLRRGDLLGFKQKPILESCLTKEQIATLRCASFAMTLDCEFLAL